MNVRSIPSDAFVLRPPTDRRAWFYAVLGLVVAVPAVGGIVQGLAGGGLLHGYIMTSANLVLWIVMLTAVIIPAQRRTLVAVSDTHVFAWGGEKRSVERDRVAWMSRGLLRDRLHDSDGRIVLKLPDLLSRDQGRQVAALLGVLHLDRRGRLIVPPTPVDARP